MDKKIQLLKEAKNELININNECIKAEDMFTRSFYILDEYALKKSEFELEEEYIELLIKNENNEQKAGYKTRIEQLEHLKQQKITLKVYYQGGNKKVNYIKQFIENSLNEKNISKFIS